jgi:uncharacterized protein (DUF952 family)
LAATIFIEGQLKSSTALMKMIDEIVNWGMGISEPVKAFCYLEQINDEKNKILLTDSNIILKYRNKSQQFNLTHIRDLSFGHKKAMLYLISGGITVPFTALAFYRDFLAPWPTLFLLFGGVFAIYVGWRGYQVLTIHLFGLDLNYRLNAISDNIRAFIAFTLKELPTNINLSSTAERMIYHITDVNTWKQKKTDTHFLGDQKDGFIHASNYHQLSATRNKHFKNQTNLLLLTIDPFKVNPEIRYEDLEGQGQLFPHIYGNLNLSAVIKVEELA